MESRAYKIPTSTKISKEKQDFLSLIAHLDERRVTILSISSKSLVYQSENGNIYRIIKRQDRFYKIRENDYIRIVPQKEKVETKKKNSSNPTHHRKKINSKKGKVVSKNATKILGAAIIGLNLGVGLAIYSNSVINSENITIVEPICYEVDPIKILPEDYEKILEQPESPIIEVPKEEIILYINEIQETNVEVATQSDMSKREETDQLFGNEIDLYAIRYGIPSSIGKALITQERPINSYINIGQLTRNVCGEKINVPIIEKTEEDINRNKELDRIYIIRDEPQEINYESPDSYKEALNLYKKQLEESRQLEKEGYQIYSYREVIDNPSLCIKISMAYLAHCVYKCNLNVNQGIRGYNSGYSVAKTASDIDIVNGTIEIGDPNYNAHVFSYLYPSEQNEIVWKLKDVSNDVCWNPYAGAESQSEVVRITPTTVIDLQFNNIKESDYAKENGPHF